MKRPMRMLAVAGITAAALALAGCAGSPNSDAKSTDSGSGGDAKTTLSVSVWDYAATPEFKALFDAFHAANPNITIQPVDVPNAADYEAKVTTMLAGGDSTDIITVKNLTDYSGYASKQQLLNLNSVEKQVPADKLAGLDSYKYKGTYYALPYRTDFSVLFYNKTMFQQAGLDAPDNLTWDEFASDAAKLTSGSGANKVYGAYVHTWNSLVQGIAAVQNDKDLNDPSDYSYLADQYNMMLKLQKAGDIPNYGEATSQKLAYQTEFETGKAAMVPMGTWLIAPLLADKAKGVSVPDWGIAQLPQIKSGGKIVTDGGPTGFGINKNSKNQAAAKKFIEFAASEKGAEAVASIGIVPSYQSSAITTKYFGLTGMPQDDLSKKAFAPDSVKPDQPVSPNTAAIGTVLNQEHQLIMTGGKSVDDGLKEMESLVKSQALSQ
ncbi:ABC transporter substrate-binding protein [Gryllotalpicola protaetiae]|uniref:Sugar ABC transporter substrate-binding protein n=1 Tax=Gryllotalpicola protaetiae TaxID=2419771 RepID=A0A387BJ76_9MICO|nr:sugar ABC transporter substrate-binding protein [Gryllotalpicola protaetiae]AYG02292.1 sugar ABC transporter substrate-binding protein [Gryllotalpicola protaetiae]